MPEVQRLKGSPMNEKAKELASLVLTVDENLAEDTTEADEVLVNADDWRELVALALEIKG